MAAKKTATAKAPRRRLTPEDQKLRLDALAKHGSKNSPQPLTAKAIAEKLGINVGTWNVWKSNRKKKSTRGSTGRIGRPAGRRGRPRKASASLDTAIASFREIERERDQLRRVLKKVQKALSELR